MLRLGLACLFLASLAATSGCCGLGCRAGCTSGDPLTAECAGPACGGCGDCIHCRRWGALTAAHRLVCQSGCRDIYFDEWLSDPPVPKDPCGYGYCPGPFRQLWWHLCTLHTTPHPDCYVDCGDEGYVEGDYLEGDEGVVVDGAEPYYEESVPATREVLPTPRPAPTPTPVPSPMSKTSTRGGMAPRMAGGFQFQPRRTGW